MKFVSLFTGIGGLDLGLERAGWECVTQVEWDDYCTKVLEKHWPEIPRWSDIHDLNPADLPDCDAVVGGFPCQPVSLAGKRAAQDDERWLWPEFFRIVRHIRPRIVLVENVPGLASAGMGDILGDLAQIGYDTEWQSIPAAAVGAPHLRWRIFIVGYPNRLDADPIRTIQNGPSSEPSGSGGDVADPDGEGLQRHRPKHQLEESFKEGGACGSSDGERGGAGNVADADSPLGGSAGSASETLHRPETVERPRRRSSSNRDDWAVEPAVGRVAHGIPSRVDRLRGLGNAVVPQVAEWVGHIITAQTR